MDGAGEKEREFARIIYEGTTRIEDVLKKALLYGKLTSDSAIELTTPCDVESLIEGLVAKVADKAAAKGVTVVRSGRGTGCVQADSDNLTLAFEIILDNAISFSPDDGVVTVEVVDHKDEACVSIRDEGVGIPKDLLPHLLDAFHSIDVAHHTRGHKLNLAIARLVVEAHGGVLEVSSEVGCGTTLTIRLPLSTEVSPLETRC
jgi:signal transduction histidine kinase